MKKLLFAVLALFALGMTVQAATRPEWSQTTASSTTKVYAGRIALTTSLSVWPSSATYTPTIDLNGITGNISAYSMDVSTINASSATITNISATNVATNNLSVANTISASFLTDPAGLTGIDMRADPWYLSGASLEMEFGIKAPTATITTAGITTANITTANVSGALNATGGINSTAFSTFSAQVAFTAKVTGAGRLLQVVQKSTSATTTTSLDTYVNTYLTQDITPAYADSKILIRVSFPIEMIGDNSAYFTLVRGSTNISPATNPIHGFGIYSPSASDRTTVSFSYLDSPATTSATTYTLQIKSANSGTNTICGNYGAQIMILEEIAGY